MKKVKIYVLKDPTTLEIRYVGSTTNTLRQRLSQHKYKKNTENTYKTHWLRLLYDNGLSPLIECIEECTIDNYQDRETFWINYYNKRVKLTNTRMSAAGIVINRKLTSIQRSAKGHEKAVIQLDKHCNFIKIWNSASEASINLSILRTSINNVLRNRMLIAGGFHWVYKDVYTPNYHKDLSTSVTSERAVQVEIKFNDSSIQIFDSIASVSKFFNVSKAYIHLILKGKRDYFKSKHKILTITRL